MKIRIEDNPKFPELQKNLIGKIESTIARKQEELDDLKAALDKTKKGEGIKLMLYIKSYWAGEENVAVETGHDVPDAIRLAIEKFHRLNPKRTGGISGGITIYAVIEGIGVPLDKADYYHLFREYNIWPFKEPKSMK